MTLTRELIYWPGNMEIFTTVFSHQFSWGLLLGLLIAAFSFWNHLKTKRELKRYQRHLSDRMELEAKQLGELKRSRETLQKENEHLRLKVGMLNEKPDHKLNRDLEVFARAEKRMMINAPGFAAAWETAKTDAIGELQEEEQGRSLPKRLFSRLLRSPKEEAHVEEAEPVLSESAAPSAAKAS
jgi:hypothetical protein